MNEIEKKYDQCGQEVEILKEKINETQIELRQEKEEMQKLELTVTKNVEKEGSCCIIM